MFVLALGLIGGGAASAEIGTRHEELVVGVPVPIAAKSIAFDTKQLNFPADTKVSLRFTNNDVSVQHNVAIFTDESQSKSLFQGAVITGPGSIAYAVPPVPATRDLLACATSGRHDAGRDPRLPAAPPPPPSRGTRTP